MSMMFVNCKLGQILFFYFLAFLSFIFCIIKSSRSMHMLLTLAHSSYHHHHIISFIFPTRAMFEYHKLGQLFINNQQLFIFCIITISIFNFSRLHFQIQFQFRKTAFSISNFNFTGCISNSNFNFKFTRLQIQF